MSHKVEDLAQKLVIAWMTKSNGRLEFEKNEQERETIVKQAEELGIMRDVYRRASDIFWGN
jgi:hypothetical protein